MTAAHAQLVAPRLETPPGAYDATKNSSRLPDDLLSEQIRRLALFAAVVGGLWAFGLSLDALIVPLTVAGAWVDYRAIALELGGIALGAAMYVYTTRGSQTTQWTLNVGLAYMILNSGGVALLNTWAGRSQTLQNADLHPSWISVLILVFSMISPMSPRRLLLASLGAASLDPLAVWVAHLHGVPVTPPWITILLFLPNYVSAVVTVVPAHYVQRMGRRLREAAELGSYRLAELLGHGGMGDVWRAEHRLLARDAAIKLVRPETFGARTDAEAAVMLRRFEREAKITASLSSPHTIEVFDFGVTNEGVFYYVMELLVGRDLESLVREFGPLPADRVLYLLRQASHSLADAHSRGFVHRDIKPANIYACRMGLDYDFVKVLDFGLVKINEAADGAPHTLLTVEHTTTGTPAYMAPEIVLGNPVDHRADVYALGCVAYFLLTGRLVFEADTPMRMMLQHVNTAPVPPSQRTELPIPPALDALVLACLEKEPDRRPPSAEQLLAMMEVVESTATWSPTDARQWWRAHLPSLTGSLAPSRPVMAV